jgi:membrane protease YdiL (CAAX protease family)
MSNTERFRFEDEDLDFPIYNRNPHIPKIGWVLLFIAVFVGFIFTLGSKITSGIIGVAIMLIPLLYFLKWDYKLIFQKPKAKDIALAVALFVGYIIYGLIVGSLLEQIGIVVSTADSAAATSTLADIPPLIFSLMGEELVKFIPFMFFLRLFFKYTENRKLSVIISMLIIMVFFGALHSFDLNTFIFALFVQGLGSIFEFYGYIKTKNLLISYITHLCTDVSIYLIAILGFA